MSAETAGAESGSARRPETVVVAAGRPHAPGCDPGHQIAARQMRGFGAVLAFDVADAATADGVCDRLRVVSSATSLGGVESTIERRAKLPGQEHVPPGLLRLSVGCEHLEDLWTDLAHALAHAGTGLA
jgi:cystathionine gamma-synthase